LKVKGNYTLVLFSSHATQHPSTRRAYTMNFGTSHSANRNTTAASSFTNPYGQQRAAGASCSHIKYEFSTSQTDKGKCNLLHISPLSPLHPDESC